MKKILIIGLLAVSTLFAYQNKQDNCIEHRLGNSTTYIVTCGSNTYKVKYRNTNNDEIIEFEELGKTKKENKQVIKK